MTNKDIGKIIAGLIVGVVGMLGVTFHGGAKAVPVETEAPKMSVTLSPGIPLGVSAEAARECFEGGGNYRHGAGGCVPVNVK